MTIEEAYMQGFNHKCGGMGVDPRKLMQKFGLLASPNPDNTLMAAGGIQTARDVAGQSEALKQQMSQLPAYKKVKESQTPANAVSRSSIGMAAGPYGT